VNTPLLAYKGLAYNYKYFQFLFNHAAHISGVLEFIESETTYASKQFQQTQITV